MKNNLILKSKSKIYNKQLMDGVLTEFKDLFYKSVENEPLFINNDLVIVLDGGLPKDRTVRFSFNVKSNAEEFYNNVCRKLPSLIRKLYPNADITTDWVHKCSTIKVYGGIAKDITLYIELYHALGRVEVHNEEGSGSVAIHVLFNVCNSMIDIYTEKDKGDKTVRNNPMKIVVV